MSPILFAAVPLFLIAIILVVVRNKSESSMVAPIVATTIAIILLAVAFVPALNILDENIPSGLEYDDYFETDATDSSGSLEILTIGDKQYAHAKSLGSGSLTFADGSEESYRVGKADLDVFLFMGQSNIAYWKGKYIDGTYYDHAIPSDVTPTITPGHAYYYGSESSPYTPDLTNLSELSILDMTDLETGDNKVGSLDGAFASNYYETTETKCLIINGAWSGKSITSFVQGGATYNHAKQGYNDALSKIDDGFNVHIKGYVWCQGEADRLMDKTTYMDYFLDMHTLLTDGTFSSAKLPVCYIDLIREYWGGNSYYAQIDLADQISNVKMSSTISSTFSMDNGTLMADNLHYTQEGQNQIAVQLVSNIV